MKKGFNIQTYDTGRTENLKAKYDIKIIDDEENLHQDNCFGNWVIKSFGAVDFVRSERLAKHINKLRKEMATMSATIQEPVFDEEFTEECDSHFNTEFFPKQPSTSK